MPSEPTDSKRPWPYGWSMSGGSADIRSVTSVSASETRSESEWPASESIAAELPTIPATSFEIERKRLTAAPTHVIRDASPSAYDAFLSSERPSEWRRMFIQKRPHESTSGLSDGRTKSGSSSCECECAWAPPCIERVEHLLPMHRAGAATPPQAAQIAPRAVAAPVARLAAAATAARAAAWQCDRGDRGDLLIVSARSRKSRARCQRQRWRTWRRRTSQRRSAPLPQRTMASASNTSESPTNNSMAAAAKAEGLQAFKAGDHSRAASLFLRALDLGGEVHTLAPTAPRRLSALGDHRRRSPTPTRRSRRRPSASSTRRTTGAPWRSAL